MNFRYKLMRFMSGRYGIDIMFYALFVVAVALSVANIFIRSFVLQIIVDAVIVFALYRAFSRNVEARRRENRWAISWLQKIKRQQNLRRRRKMDYNHVYKKCPKCRAMLRLPRRVGKHKTICPKCNHAFSVRVR